MPVNGNYQPQLFCVECGGVIKDLVCQKCKHEYDVVEGVPCLIPGKTCNLAFFSAILTTIQLFPG